VNTGCEINAIRIGDTEFLLIVTVGGAVSSPGSLPSPADALTSVPGCVRGRVTVL
jgi:hypothetical protein